MMKVRSLPVFIALAISCVAVDAAEPGAALQHAKKLLSRAPIVDGHNDLPITLRQYEKAPGDVVAYDLRQHTSGHTDIPRLHAGGVGGQFWSVYIPGESGSGFARMQLEQIDLARRIIERYPDTFELTLTAAAARKAMRHGRIASFLGMEGGHAIENSLGALRAYYDLGVRYMTLTHNTHTDWADSAAQIPRRHNGLTPFGEEVVHEMNRLGMLVDLAHTADATALDALRVSEAPVIFSHAGARALCDLQRNVPDNVLLELKRNGGVFMITFVSGFVDCEVAKITQPLLAGLGLRLRQAANETERKKIYDELDSVKLPPTPIAKVADHIEHVRDIVGVEHIGLGGDFDGASWWPVGLSDVSMYPNLFAELIRRGWSDHDLRLLAGENILNALARAEQVAKRLQASRPASTLRFIPPPARE
jgi:membrane dipeptidase